MTAGEREKQNVNKTHGRLFSPSNVHTLVQDYVQANRCSSKKKKTKRQNKTHNSHTNTLANVDSGTHEQKSGHAYPLHRVLLALWHLPPTQQRSVGGWIISLPWGRGIGERKEGEREVVPSPSSRRFMESAEPSNRQNSVPLPLADAAQNIRTELYWKYRNNTAPGIVLPPNTYGISQQQCASLSFRNNWHTELHCALVTF